MPPLEFLLPQREVLFRYIQDSGRYTFEEVHRPKPRLIFGIRPCDLRAVAVLDRIFGSDPLDHPYFDKRRSTVLVGLELLTARRRLLLLALESGPECSDLIRSCCSPRSKMGIWWRPARRRAILIMKEHPEFFLEAQESHLAEKSDSYEEGKCMR